MKKNNNNINLISIWIRSKANKMIMLMSERVAVEEK